MPARVPGRRLPLPESLDGCSLALRKAFRDCEDRHGYPAAAAIVQDFDDDDRARAAVRGPVNWRQRLPGGRADTLR